ncbi:MAG: hypothetical protein ACLFTK_01515 [Anaerolineales bacterium]
MLELEHYRDYLSQAEFDALQASLGISLPQSLRVNTLRHAPDIAQDWAARYAWLLEPAPFSPAGWRLRDYDRQLGRRREHLMGDYFIQEAASMLPAELFSAADAPLVLDMAAAPGGKTTHLADRFADRALILANDSSARRLHALRANLQTWGAVGVAITHFKAEHFGAWFPETFDKILLDAPCSGDTLRPTKGRKARAISPNERAQLAARQAALLESAFAALAPGGELVYSTCTLSPDENEAHIDALLRRYAMAEVVPTRFDAPGLTHTPETDFHPALADAVRLWNHRYHTAGFFAVCLRKTDHAPTLAHETPPARAMDDLPWERATPDVLETLCGTLRDDYGLENPPWDDTLYDIYVSHDTLYALPKRLFETFGGLPLFGAGLLIGGWMADAFIPSHELVARYWPAFTQRRVTLPPEQVDNWLAGADWHRDAPPDLLGRVALLQTSAGDYLGRGKVLAKRIRNLLPKGARR